MRLPSFQETLTEGTFHQPECFDKLFSDWKQELASQVPELEALFSRSQQQQLELGYYHTLHEIYQQPLTWLETAQIVSSRRDLLKSFLHDAGIVDHQGELILSGSGSSHFVGDSLVYGLQKSLGIPVHAVPSGLLLTHSDQATPPQRPCVMISIARSGDSPESIGALEFLLEQNPLCRHLIITCNRHGRLATSYQNDPRVLALVLADKTCDRSLVMTSSFTNMVLSGQFLGYLDSRSEYENIVEELAGMGSSLLLKYSSALALVAQRNFRSAIYLGSGGRYGAARESALKMLEMTAGRVMTFAETYLGLRHGPMSAVHPETLLVCFLASDPLVRAYEMDLITELNRKGLGMQKIIVGENVPNELVLPADLVVEVPGIGKLGDENVPVLDALVGQVLGLFRCMRCGLKPDSPSTGGVINRVVGKFTIHKR